VGRDAQRGDAPRGDAQRGDSAAVVRRYLELGSSGDVDAASAYEHPDIRIWVSGRLIVSGDLTITQYRKAAAGVHDTFPGGYTLHLRSVTEQDGRVAVEARGDGVLANGTRYTPEYAMFFEVADGRITSIREYIDTEYVAATFRLPAKAG
jgi:uncharacterized protein